MEVIILGMANSREQCAFDTETWSVNNGYRQIITCLACHVEKRGTFYLDRQDDKMVCPKCNAESIVPRLDKIFLAHTQCWDVDGDALFNWDELNYLADKGVEIINTHRVKGLKATMYPLKTILKRFKRDYFSDTLAYMLAYAIYKGYTKVYFPGCDMHTASEYMQEKGGIEYWMGRAEERGIELVLCEGSSLLKTATGHPYGTNIPQKIYYMDNKGKKRLYKLKKNKPNFTSRFDKLDEIRTPE